MSRSELIARARHWETSLTRRTWRPDEGPEDGRVKSTWDMTPEEREHARAFLDAARRARDEEREHQLKAPIEWIPVPSKGPALVPSSKEAKRLHKSLGNLASGGKLSRPRQAQVRDYLRAQIDQYNFSLRDPRDGSGSTLQVVKNHRARGSHWSDGRIAIDRRVAENAAKFVQDVAAGEDYAKVLRDHRQRGYFLDQNEVRKLEEVKTRANDYRTFVHEQVHGYGPRSRNSESYQREGVFTEEVATEVSARKIVRDQLGLEHGDHRALSRPGGLGDDGSYTPQIYSATAAINEIAEEALGRSVGHEKAYDLLERASMRYKTLDEHIGADTPEGATRLFARSIDPEHLAKVVGRPITSDEHERFVDALHKRFTEYGRGKRRPR